MEFANCDVRALLDDGEDELLCSLKLPEGPCLRDTSPSKTPDNKPCHSEIASHPDVDFVITSSPPPFEERNNSDTDDTEYYEFDGSSEAGNVNTIKTDPADVMTQVVTPNLVRLETCGFAYESARIITESSEVANRKVPASVIGVETRFDDIRVKVKTEPADVLTQLIQDNRIKANSRGTLLPGRHGLEAEMKAEQDDLMTQIVPVSPIRVWDTIDLSSHQSEAQARRFSEGNDTDSDLDETVKVLPRVILPIPPLPKDVSDVDESSSESQPLVFEESELCKEKPIDQEYLVPTQLDADVGIVDELEMVKARAFESPGPWSFNQNMTQETQQFEPLSLELPCTQDFEAQVAKATKKDQLPSYSIGGQNSNDFEMGRSELAENTMLHPELNGRVFQESTQVLQTKNTTTNSKPSFMQKTRIDRSFKQSFTKANNNLFLEETQVHHSHGNSFDKANKNVFLEDTQVHHSHGNSFDKANENIFLEETQMHRSHENSFDKANENVFLEETQVHHAHGNSFDKANENVFLEETQVYHLHKNSLGKANENVFLEEAQVHHSHGNSFGKTNESAFLQETQAINLLGKSITDNFKECRLENQVFLKDPQASSISSGATNNKDLQKKVFTDGSEFFRQPGIPILKSSQRKLQDMTDSIFLQSTQVSVPRSNIATYHTSTKGSARMCSKQSRAVDDSIFFESTQTCSMDSSVFSMATQMLPKCSPLSKREASTQVKLIAAAPTGGDLDIFDILTQSPSTATENQRLNALSEKSPAFLLETQCEAKVDSPSLETESDSEIDAFIPQSPQESTHVVGHSDQTDENTEYYYEETFESQSKKVKYCVQTDIVTQVNDKVSEDNFDGSHLSVKLDCDFEAVTQVNESVSSPAGSNSSNSTESNLGTGSELPMDMSMGPASPPLDFDGPSQVYGLTVVTPEFNCEGTDSEGTRKIFPSISAHDEFAACDESSKESTSLIQNAAPSVVFTTSTIPEEDEAYLMETQVDASFSTHQVAENTTVMLKQPVMSDVSSALTFPGAVALTPSDVKTLNSSEVGTLTSAVAVPLFNDRRVSPNSKPDALISSSELPSTPEFERQLGEAEARYKSQLAISHVSKQQENESSCRSVGDVGRPKRVRKATWKVRSLMESGGSNSSKKQKLTGNEIDVEDISVRAASLIRQSAFVKLTRLGVDSQGEVILPRQKKNVAPILENNSSTSQESECAILPARQKRCMRLIDSNSSDSYGKVAKLTTRSVRTRASSLKTAHVSETSTNERTVQTRASRSKTSHVSERSSSQRSIPTRSSGPMNIHVSETSASDSESIGSTKNRRIKRKKRVRVLWSDSEEET